MSNGHPNADFGLEKWMTIPALKWLASASSRLILFRAESAVTGN